MSTKLDLAHAARLVDDILTETGASQRDRQAVADHLTRRRCLDAQETGRHDSWSLTTALAETWQAYSERAHLPSRALLNILDGTCSTVTSSLDAETVTEILETDKNQPDPGQVQDFLHWLEREDIWDDDTTAERVRAAWTRYRTRAAHLRRGRAW